MSTLTYPTNVYSQRLGVEYLYDSSSVLSQVRNATATSTVYYALNTQDGSGAVRKATLGNGIVEQYGYEATTGQLATIKAGMSGSAALQNLELMWDMAGNLGTRRVLDASNAVVSTDVFGYDALDRLQSQTRNSSQIFGVTYDTGHLGNIATKTGVTGTYSYGAGSAGPHAVTAIGTSMTFDYDENGNMKDRNGDTITWTRYNLPLRIDGPGTAYSEFLYGGDRSRYVQKEDDGTSTHTRHYAAPGLFEAVYSGSTHLSDSQYVQANGHAVAQITTTSSGNDTKYLHRDHQGSVVATTNTSGTVLDRFEYDPFGQRTATVGSEDGNPRGYTGHEHLPALDLVHMNGRVQDPLLGRFLSADPLGWEPYHAQLLNRYSYVRNNPLSLVDPSGFQDCKLGDLENCTPEQRDAMKCRQDQVWCGQGNTHFVRQTGGENIFAPNLSAVAQAFQNKTQLRAQIEAFLQSGEQSGSNNAGNMGAATSDSGGANQREFVRTTTELPQSFWDRIVADLSAPGANSCGAAGGAQFPNAIGGVSFNGACVSHDDCYGTLGAGKGSCDWAFRRDIRETYRERGAVEARLGDKISNWYFLSVTIFGGKAYESAQLGTRLEKAQREAELAALGVPVYLRYYQSDGGELRRMVQGMGAH